MEDLKTIIESLLFVADNPMSIEKLNEVIEEADTKSIRGALRDLLREFDDPKRGFQLREVAGGYQFRTHPECQAYIRRLLKPAPSRLSRAALETLAIIAYKQPIIRSDVEHIRGVDSGGVLRVLMEKKLVRVLGRREIPGRPLIYATTKHFLEVFDLKNLRDLPTPKEIEELTAQEPDLEALQPELTEPFPDASMPGPDEGTNLDETSDTQQKIPATRIEGTDRGIRSDQSDLKDVHEATHAPTKTHSGQDEDAPQSQGATSLTAVPQEDLETENSNGEEGADSGDWA